MCIRDRYHDFTHDEDGPMEEEIWKYSPLQRDMSDKTTSAAEFSDDYEDVQNPSSTPIVPNRLKTVLNFTNIHVPSADEDPITQENADEQTRPRPTNTSPRGSFRNIDDILDDIEGDLTLKPKMMKFNDLPSSPTKAPDVAQPEVAVEKADNVNTTGDSNDGDDSLIDILTQKYVEKHKDITESQIADQNNGDDRQSEESEDNNEPKVADKANQANKNQTDQGCLKIQENEKSEEDLSDEFSDDSLIELLNVTQTQGASNAIEQEIEKVEAMVSHDLKVDSDTSLSTYIHKAKSGAPREGVVRLVITSIRTVELPKIGTQKILECVDSKGEISSVVVRHPWVYLEFEAGDVIHIIEGKNIENKRLLSDDKHPKTQLANDNLLVLNPDILFSATSVGSSVGCLRRAILQMQFRDPRGEPSLVMTLGNIVHELLQDSIKYKLSHSRISMEYLVQKLDSLLETYSFAIIICNEEIQSVKELVIKEHAENILHFVNKYVSKNNYGCYTSVSGTRRTQPISISNVIDIEENIWSPIYGLKGFLDATVEANVENNQKCIVPLEVKTGKSRSVAYEVQGLIYTLLLNDRYEIPIDFFLLYFTRDHNMTKYPSILHSIKPVSYTHLDVYKRQQQKCVVFEKLQVHRKTISPLKARQELAVVGEKNSEYSKRHNVPEVAYSIKPEALIINGNIGKIKEINEQTESNSHIEEPHLQESLKTTSLAVSVESPQVIDVKKYFQSTNPHPGAPGVIRLNKTQGLQETEEKCSEPGKIGRKLSQKRSDLQDEYNVSIAARNTFLRTDEDECGKNVTKSDSSFYHDPEFPFFHTGSLVAIEKKPTNTSIVDKLSTTLQSVNEEHDSTIFEHRKKKKEERGNTVAEGMSNISDINKRSFKETSVVKKSAKCDSGSFGGPIPLLPENDLLSIELEVRTLMLKTKTEIFKFSGLMNDKGVKKQLSDPRVRRSLLRTRDEIFDDVNRLFSDLLTEQNDCCS